MINVYPFSFTPLCFTQFSSPSVSRPPKNECILVLFPFSQLLFFLSSLFGQRPRRGRWPMLSYTGEISPPPSPPPSSPSPSPPLASKLKSQPQAQITVSSLNPRLRAQIPTLWLKSQLHRSYSNLLAQIPALWLKLQPSIGHRFLRGLLTS